VVKRRRKTRNSGGAAIAGRRLIVWRSGRGVITHSWHMNVGARGLIPDGARLCNFRGQAIEHPDATRRKLPAVAVERCGHHLFSSKTQQHWKEASRVTAVVLDRPDAPPKAARN